MKVLISKHLKFSASEVSQKKELVRVEVIIIKFLVTVARNTNNVVGNKLAKPYK